MTDGREPQVTAIKQGRGRLQKEQLLRRGASVSLKRGFAHSGGHEAGRGGQNVRGMRGRAQAPRQPGRKFREEPSQIDLQACGECGHRYSALKNIVVRQRGIRAGFTPGGSRSVHPCSRTGAEALGGERVERDWGAGEGRLPGTGSRAEDTLSTLGGFQGGAVGSYKGNAKQQGLRHDVDWVFSGQDTGGGFSTVAGSEGDVRSKLLRRERWQSRQDKSPGREEAASSFRQDPGDGAPSFGGLQGRTECKWGLMAAESFRGKYGSSWEDEESELIHNSVAPATWKAYAAGLMAVTGFLTNIGCHSRNVSDRELCQFIIAAKQAGCSIATVRSHLAGFAFFQKVQGCPNPMNSFRVKKVLGGWQRGQGHKEDKWRPIRYVDLCILVEVLPQICWSAFEPSMFRLAFSWAFFGAMRISELVAQSRRAVREVGMLKSNVQIRGSEVRLFIPRSKTDQTGKGAVVALLCDAQRSVCPVRLAHGYMRLRPNVEGPFFIHEDSFPLTRFQFSKVLGSAIHKAGGDPRYYSLHSFRIGAATAAAEAGMSDTEIKGLGRWKLEAFRSYVRPSF
ncbi:uncharacterized protein LOC115088071 isoform X1 [Rhinatrema bivittatum]|uniref:uncharacterized protein LOC115088071 isoform X1 n=1 Tax=Rhinatrema bivittatum TaxID=194408 RepID=UPI00112A50C6|nr:uncharacterized protein LOC115088071 isoform X1 [Rhinatrema bivittatum]